MLAHPFWCKLHEASFSGKIIGGLNCHASTVPPYARSASARNIGQRRSTIGCGPAYKISVMSPTLQGRDRTPSPRRVEPRANCGLKGTRSRSLWSGSHSHARVASLIHILCVRNTQDIVFLCTSLRLDFLFFTPLFSFVRHIVLVFRLSHRASFVCHIFQIFCFSYTCHRSPPRRVGHGLRRGG